MSAKLYNIEEDLKEFSLYLNKTNSKMNFTKKTQKEDDVLSQFMEFDFDKELTQKSESIMNNFEFTNVENFQKTNDE